MITPTDQTLAEDQRALVARSSQLDSCYADLSLRAPEAGGTMMAAVTLAPDGTVADVCITQATTLDDHEIAQCVIEELRTMKFKPPGKHITALLPLEVRPHRSPIPFQHSGRNRGDRYCDIGSGTNEIPGGPCD